MHTTVDVPGPRAALVNQNIRVPPRIRRRGRGHWNQNIRVPPRIRRRGRGQWNQNIRVPPRIRRRDVRCAPRRVGPGKTATVSPYRSEKSRFQNLQVWYAHAGPLRGRRTSRPAAWGLGRGAGAGLRLELREVASTKEAVGLSGRPKSDAARLSS